MFLSRVPVGVLGYVGAAFGGACIAFALYRGAGECSMCNRLSRCYRRGGRCGGHSEDEEGKSEGEKKKARSLLSVDALSKEQIATHLRLTDSLKQKVKNGLRVPQTLAGKSLTLLFYEASTRTRCSFEAAMKRLGGHTIGVTEPASSSVSKGESLSDTVKVLSAYTDGLVIRHPDISSASEALDASCVPVINAGNGAGEHPTQALVDAFTIYSKFPQLISDDKSITPLRITVVGDLENGRTTHSLVKLLARYNTTFTYVAPDTLQMPEKVKQEVETIFKENEVVDWANRQQQVSSLPDALKQSDIVYMTRLQKERMSSSSNNKLGNLDVLTHDMLETFAPKECKVLHPLPRLSEISTDVDKNERQTYFEQAENGLYVRMAILTLMFDSIRGTRH